MQGKPGGVFYITVFQCEGCPERHICRVSLVESSISLFFNVRGVSRAPHMQGKPGGVFYITVF